MHLVVVLIRITPLSNFEKYQELSYSKVNEVFYVDFGSELTRVVAR